MQPFLEIPMLAYFAFAAAIPGLVSLTPTDSTATSATYTAVYSHTAGADAHYLAYLFFIPVPNVVWFDAAGSCIVEFNRLGGAFDGNGGFRLINDAGDNWLGPLPGVAAGSSASLGNRRCTLDVAKSSGRITGETLSVTAAVRFTEAGSGQYGTFLQARDVFDRVTDVRQFGGLITPTVAARPGPAVVGFTPLSAAGHAASFVMDVMHSGGVDKLAEIHMRVSSAIVGVPACHIIYFPASNLVNMVNDAGDALVSSTGVMPGSALALNSSRCTATGADMRRNVSGNTLQIALPVTFNPNVFVGDKNVYVNAFDITGNLTHWVRGGTYIIEQPVPPLNVTMTAPSAGSTHLAPASLNLSADATGDVMRVDFLNGSTVICTDMAAPYACSWTAPAGTYSLRARAVDNSGAISTSPAASVVVKGIRIMPVGDSITHGADVPGGYRIGLWSRLLGAGAHVDYVGSELNGPTTLIDQNHQGHRGWRIDQIQGIIGSRLATHQPQIVLLHIGTNDVIQEYALSSAPGRLSALIDQITAGAPQAYVVVASIIPLQNATRNSRAAQFNATIPGIVDAKRAAGKRVVYVNMYNAVSTADLYDGIHPNSNGYDKMAAAWYQALAPIVPQLSPQ
jgi:lysophospholipase L1-like esterase